MDYEQKLREKGFDNVEGINILLIPSKYLKDIPVGFDLIDFVGKHHKFDGKTLTDKNLEYSSFGVPQDKYKLMYDTLFNDMDS